MVDVQVTSWLWPPGSSTFSILSSMARKEVGRKDTPSRDVRHR